MAVLGYFMDRVSRLLLRNFCGMIGKIFNAILADSEGVTVMWDLTEAISYYKSLGAPQDQSAMISLLQEIQRENGGSIPPLMLKEAAEGFGVRESLLLALIRRVPRLRLAEIHVLEICSGPKCGKKRALAAYAEKLHSEKIQVRFVPCMRMCGKGPNIRFDGTVFHQVDETLLKQLLEK